MSETRPFAIEEFISLKRPYQISAAGDGSVCAFAVTEADFDEGCVVSRLWAADADGERTRRIARSHEGEEAPLFSPDGAWVAFLSSRPDFSRPEPELEEGEEPRAQLWVLPVDGGEARCLTGQREGVRDFDWLPDSSGLVFLALEARPKTLQAHRFNSLQSKNDAVEERKERRPVGFWRVDVEEDGEEKRIWRGEPGVMSVSVSPDGERAVFATNSTGDPNDYAKTDLWILDLKSGETRRLTDRPGGEWEPQWSPDGSEILFVASLDPELSYSQARLWTVPSAGGEIRPVLPDFDCEIEGAIWPRRSPHAFFFVTAEGLGSILYRYEIGAEEPERLIAEEGVITAFDASEDGRILYLVFETATSWADLYRLDLDFRDDAEDTSEEIDEREASDISADHEDRDASDAPADEENETTIGEEEPLSPFMRISDLNPDWREARLGSQRPYRWTCDGWDIEGLLVLPPDAPKGQPLPLIAYVHGGPHSSTQNALRHGVCLQWLAQMGYAVLAPNYRGSAGYGSKFSVANWKDLGGGDYRDILAGIDSVIADGIADPDRLAILGGSYGGYMTNWAISQIRRFRAAVSLFGIFNWITDYSNSEISNFEKDYLGGHYWEDPALYLERSPFRYVQDIETPVLIMHGESDANTFISNSREMHQALRALGRTVSFIRYPREEHGFLEPRHRADMHDRIAKWLDAYLVGEGPERPAAYRMDQDVPGDDGWTLRVTSADSVTLAGREEPEDAIFLQTVFALRSPREKASRRISLNDLRVEADGSERPFLGVPLKTLDETVLIEGSDMRVAFDGGDAPSAFPVAAVFQVPKGQAEMILRVPGFPAILVPLPKSDRKGEGEPERETQKIARDENSAAMPGPGQKPRGDAGAEA